MKHRHNLILIFVFALMLALPTIGSLGHFSRNKSINENRRLAHFPKLRYDPAVWNYYFNDLQSYYEDHFGFRESFIAFGLMSKRALFPAELGPDVLYGRHGWLYLKRDRDADLTDECLGMNKFSPGELKAAQTQLEARRDWLAARGIKYVFVIAPDKQSIYPQYLPEWLKPAAFNRTDQFVEFMHGHSTVEVLDIGAALRLAVEQTPVYYLTDAHWNVMGAWVAFQTIATNLNRQIPELAPLQAEDFRISLLPGYGGDLARMAGQPELVESNRYLFSPGPNLPLLTCATPNAEPVNLPLLWSLPVPQTETVTLANPQRLGRVLVFGDSFAMELLPFLGFDFEKTICRRKAFDKILVRESRPDVVLDEVVERNLFLPEPSDADAGDK